MLDVRISIMDTLDGYYLNVEGTLVKIKEIEAIEIADKLELEVNKIPF